MKISFLKNSYKKQCKKSILNNIKNKDKFIKLNFHELSFLKGGNGDEEDETSYYIPSKK